MAERVVDFLEAVEVHHQQGKNPILALRGQDCLVQTVLEQRPVRKLREPIMQGLMLERLLPLFAVGDVAEAHDEST